LFASLFTIAFRGIFRNWRQSITALTSIAATFVSLTLFQGYMDDVQKMYENTNVEREMMGNIIIERTNSVDKMTKADQEKAMAFLNSRSDVDAKVRFLPMSGTITNGKTSMVFVGMGIDVTEGRQMRQPSWAWNTLAGRPLEDENEGLVIGHKLARILDCEPDPILDFKQGLGGFAAKERPMNCKRNNLQLNVVTVNAQMNAMTMPLTGITDAIYKELDERYVQVPIRMAQQLFDTTDIGYMTVKLKSKKDIPDFLEAAKKHFAGSDLHAVRWQDHRLGDLYNKTMDLLSIFRNLMVTVILIISSLSVFNTFIRNISERQKEIGTLRSIGFNPFKIRVLFGLEAIVLSITGCVMGLITSTLLEYSVNFLGITYKPGIFSSPVPFTIYVSPYLLAQVTLFLVTLVIITAMISLRKPLKQTITECFAHV
jgi:ABC-type lipoprotein release transport system permease subunit